MPLFRPFTRTHLALGIYLGLTALPLGLGLGYALAYSLGLTGLLQEGFTLAHWREVLQSAFFWRSLGFSAYVAVATMSLTVAIALVAVLVRPGAFLRGALSYFIYVPLAIPAVVMAFWAFQLLAKSGLVSRVGYALGLASGLDQFPDLINDRWGIGIILVHLMMAIPFFIILLSNLYQHERLDNLAQLAATLGARRWQVVRRVLAPALLQRAFPTVVLYGLFVMSAYEVPLLLGSQSRQMISVLAVEKLQRYNLADIPQAYVISVVYGLLVMGLVWWWLGRER